MSSGKVNAKFRAMQPGAIVPATEAAANSCSQPSPNLKRFARKDGVCLSEKEKKSEKAKVDRRMSNVARSKRSVEAAVKEIVQYAIEEQQIPCTRLSRLSSVATAMLADIAYNAILHLHKHATTLSVSRKGKFVVARDISAAINMMDPDLPGARVEKMSRDIFKDLKEKREKYLSELKSEDKLKKKATHLANLGLLIPHYLVQRIASHQSQAAGKLPISAAIFIGLYAQLLVIDVVNTAIGMSAKQETGENWTLMPAHISRGIQSSDRLRRIISDHKLLGQHSHAVAADYNVSDVILRKRGAVPAKCDKPAAKKRKAPASQGGKAPKKAKKGAEASEKAGCGASDRYGAGLCSLKRKPACASSKAQAIKKALAILSDAEDDSCPKPCPCPRKRKMPARCKKDAGCRKLGSVASMLRKWESDSDDCSSSSDSDSSTSSSSSSDSDCKPCNRKGRRKTAKKYACLTREQMLKKLKDAKCKEAKLKKKAKTCATTSTKPAALAPPPTGL